MAADAADLDELIAQWRDYRRQPGLPPDATETLEQRLRDEATALIQTGLSPNEAFIIAIARIDAPARDFGREIWDRIAQPPPDAPESAPPPPSRPISPPADLTAAGILAIAAAAVIKIPALFGHPIADDSDNSAQIYALNLGLFAFPMLTAYFAWQRRLHPRQCLPLAIPFLAAAALVNAYPFNDSSAATPLLTALHLPIALWLVVGVAHTGGRWAFGGAAWMNFVRFSGEFVLYYLLIAIGGGALTALGWALFDAIGVDVSSFIQQWALPCGAMGAIPICAWLVESRRRTMENLAPMLARVFTPLVALLLLGFLLTMAAAGRGINADRDALIAFDLLLALVFGLLLYSASARHPHAPPNLMDGLTALLAAAALIADAAALAAIAARITEFGFSPNKIAALGENLILLLNLAWAFQLYVRFLRRRAPFHALERWQTAYLPIFALWAAIVALAFPPLFGYA